MFFIGMKDNITRLELRPERHYIYPMTGVQGKYYFFVRIGINKILYNVTRALHSPVRIAVDTIGYFLGKPVPAPAFTAGRKIIVILVKRLYNPLRNKRITGIIEIDWRVSVLEIL